MFPDKIIDDIRMILRQQDQSVAVAESVTAGLLQAAFASAEEAVQFFQGGITAYNVGQKARHLDIDPVKAIACNCVSAEIATDMAAHVSRLFVCDWSIAVTGYATPVPESGDKIFAHFTICHRGKKKCAKKITTKKKGLGAQLDYVRTILKQFLSILEKEYQLGSGKR